MAERLSLSEENDGVAEDSQRLLGDKAQELLQKVRLGQGVQILEAGSSEIDVGHLEEINISGGVVTMTIKMSETHSFVMSGRLQETPVILRTYVEGQDISITVGTTTVRMNLG